TTADTFQARVGALGIAKSSVAEFTSEGLTTASVVLKTPVPFGRHSASAGRTDRNATQREARDRARNAAVARMTAEDGLHFLEEFFRYQRWMRARSSEVMPADHPRVERAG